MSTKTQQREAMEAAEETGMNPAVMASAISVGMSLFEFFIRGNKQRGIFIGLWPPTILAFASYFQQTRMKDKLDYAMGKPGIVESVERMIQRPQE